MTYRFDADRVRQNWPSTLAILPQYLVWRFEQKADAPKPAKMPYYANGKRRTGKQGSDADRAALVLLEEALQACKVRRFNGVGIAFLPGDGLIGIDLDRVIDPETGKIKPGARRIVKACDSYTEYSPSGAGLHIIVLTDREFDRAVRSNALGLEIYSGRQYFTITGMRYGE